ncbi:TetR/AcrR family transcriptional regulator [Kitasatospora indigofera]|uniref:TetR/AcrR family transcriptional regulator n=1 Tax=Kitasatospora indigofera TaxID=67307 RepID=UPI0036C81E64
MPANRGTPPRVGRPRAKGPSASELTPRAEVLAAAAELFTVNGYAATTTRAVAERAGLRQASLYHYFTGKDDILATLLESTVEPSLTFAGRLLAGLGECDKEAAAAGLWALAAFDAELLFGGLYNLGALYQLPEVRGERFAGFRRSRGELKAAYGTLLARLDEAGDPALRTDLLLGLVEGGVAVARETGGRQPREVGEAVADAALRLAGRTVGQTAAARTAAARLRPA